MMNTERRAKVHHPPRLCMHPDASSGLEARNGRLNALALPLACETSQCHIMTNHDGMWVYIYICIMSLSLSIYIYIYVCICVYVYIHEYMFHYCTHYIHIIISICALHICDMYLTMYLLKFTSLVSCSAVWMSGPIFFSLEPVHGAILHLLSVHKLEHFWQLVWGQ